MSEPIALQLILGPDKRNPCFCLYTDPAEKELHVYYGLELLEVVPNDRNDPAYRLLAARLYNAGLRVGTLQAVFGLDRKTLRRWGLALRSGDLEWLMKVLTGRGGRRKLTVEMESYVRLRWTALRAEGRRDYRQRLQAELKRVFRVEVCGETLRPLLRQLRAEGASEGVPKEAAARPEGAEGHDDEGGRRVFIMPDVSPVLPGLEVIEAAAQAPRATEEVNAPVSLPPARERSIPMPGPPPPPEPASGVERLGSVSGEVTGVSGLAGASVGPAPSKMLPPTEDGSAGSVGEAPRRAEGVNSAVAVAGAGKSALMPGPSPCPPPPPAPASGVERAGSVSGEVTGVCGLAGALVLPASSKILPPAEDGLAGSAGEVGRTAEEVNPTVAVAPTERSVPIPAPSLCPPPTQASASGLERASSQTGEVIGVSGLAGALVLPASSKILPPAEDGAMPRAGTVAGAGERAEPLAPTGPEAARLLLSGPRTCPAPCGESPSGAASRGSESAKVAGVSTPAPAGVSALPVGNQMLLEVEDWSVGETRWCEHAGLLLFWESLGAISQVVEPPQPWLRQALGSVLAGALNVEQSKYLNPEDLEVLLGPQLRGLGRQRQRLKELAGGPTADWLLRWNSQQVGAAQQSDFYLDPHTKHYTGMAEVLKGWCPSIRWADKALHSDFLHTVAGQPLYFECTDNYEDLRTRLWGIVERARAALGWPKDKVITLIIDRAVFGQPTFERVLAEPALHLITWQKGYQAGGWDEKKVSGQCVIERARNRAADRQSYQFRYIDQKWAADPRWRQLIVRATHPSGRTVEVAILTDDHARPAAELVRLMFGRWVQENDFKYTGEHFGLNQITSYGVISYAELKPQLTDRQVQSGAARALAEQGRQLSAQLGRLLWAERQAEQRQVARQARQAELEQAARVAQESSQQGGSAAASSEAAEAQAVRSRELGRLKAAQARHETSRVERQKNLKELEAQLTQTLAQQGQTKGTMSRLEDLIARHMVRLDTGPKRLLDAVKVVARNAFYRALAPFKAAYDNYRDDHEHFRRLTQSAGVLRWNGRELEVHLLPATPYGVALRRTWEQVLAGINAAKPVWPDGSGRRLVFRLAVRSELQVTLRGF